VPFLTETGATLYELQFSPKGRSMAAAASIEFGDRDLDVVFIHPVTPFRRRNLEIASL
jgi:hypothetical protein